MKENEGLFADPSNPASGAPRAVAAEAPQSMPPLSTQPRSKPARVLDEPVIVPTLGTDSAGRGPAPARTGLGPMWVMVVSLLALVFGAAGGVGGYAIASHGDSAVTDSLPHSAVNVDAPVAQPGSVTDVVAAVLPSVVRVEASSGGTLVDTGSGFVIRADGYILTNDHVVAPSDGELNVRFSDGTVSPATLVGTTSDYDLAVLKVDKAGLTPLVLADSDRVRVGDEAIAIGSPLGLDSTVTLGIVSSLHRPVTAGDSASSTAFIDAIQTDAAINPGNSGGPLLNASGEVIGINSATAALPGASQVSGSGTVGLGFAIPSNQARRTADEIIATGKATFPVIGVLLDSTYHGEGVRVLNNDPATKTLGVAPGSPADVAGIKAGDIIVSFDGRPIAMPEELIVATRAMAPGDVVTLEVKSGSSTSKVTVTLTANDKITWNDGSQK
jgi:putative serine protease PepD